MSEQLNVIEAMREFRKVHSWRLLRKVDPKLFRALVEITDYLPEQAPVALRFWHLVNGRDVPKCSTCGSGVKWDPTEGAYRTFCSVRCHNKQASNIVECLSLEELIVQTSKLSSDQVRTLRIHNPSLYQSLLHHTADLNARCKIAQRLWHVHNKTAPACLTCGGSAK